jgi:hypothetical protein
MLKRISIHYLLACLFLCGSLVSYAQQPNPEVGRVIMVLDDVYALEGNDSSRRLVRSSGIHNGDIIDTGPQSNVQFRMIDSAVVALRCDSSLKIEEYQYNQDQDDLAILRLLRGSLRMITGRIGEQHSHRYRFFVGNLLVEGKGGDIEVLLEKDGTVYFGNYNGGITITNPHGSVKLGLGGDADFAIVEPDEAPKALNFQPQQIGSVSVFSSSIQQNAGC